MIITAAQCRAARALLDWSQPDLAKRSGVHVQTISNFEHGNGSPTNKTLGTIKQILENAGILFIENDGVRVKPSGIITHKGREGFANFIWDVYETTKMKGGEICVSNIDEKLFTYWLGEEIDNAYMDKMRELKNYTFKILIKEGDYNFTAASYAEYRWIPKKQFFSVPFYAYGEKLAFLLFGDDVTIYVIDNPDITAAQKLQFNLLWNTAIIPK